MAALQQTAADSERAESEASAASAEAQELQAKLQRYSKERMLLKALLKVSLAITSDVVTGARSHSLRIPNSVFIDFVSPVP